MTENPSCRSSHHKEYIQTNVLGNPDVYIIKL